MHKNLYKLLDPLRALAERVPLEQLRPRLDGLDVVVGHVVFDPRPVGVLVQPSFGERRAEQLGGDDAVAEQARGQGHLQGGPVFGLAYVEDVSVIFWGEVN